MVLGILGFVAYWSVLDVVLVLDPLSKEISFDIEYDSIKGFYHILLSYQMAVTYEKTILVSTEDFAQFSQYKE